MRSPFFYTLIVFLVAACAHFQEVETLPPIKVERQITSLFPKQEWTNYVYKKCQAAKFTKVSLNETWYKNSAENCVHLFAAMAYYESSFKPAATYKESFKNSRGEYVISTGLFQVSYESSRGYGFSGITTDGLKDPYKNIDVAFAIMDKWAVTDGVIARGSSTKNAKGGARYWSVLRTSGKLESVKERYKEHAE